jgi:hypothetical protein
LYSIVDPLFRGAKYVTGGARELLVKLDSGTVVVGSKIGGNAKIPGCYFLDFALSVKEMCRECSRMVEFAGAPRSPKNDAELPFALAMTLS